MIYCYYTIFIEGFYKFKALVVIFQELFLVSRNRFSRFHALIVSSALNPNFQGIACIILQFDTVASPQSIQI